MSFPGNLKQLGQEIDRLLKARSHSQEWLAETIKMRQASVSRIINGKQRPSEKTLEKIADAVGVDVWYLKELAGYRVPPRTHSPEVASVAHRLEGLPPDIRGTVIEAMTKDLDLADRTAQLLKVYEAIRDEVPEHIDRLERQIEEEGGRKKSGEE